MKKFLAENKFYVIFICSLLSFLLFTWLITVIDVQAIGPVDPETGIASSVGFSTLNGWFFSATGLYMLLYEITDWGSLITLPIGLTFLIVGIVQLIKRKGLFKVDANILALGIFYVLTFFSYFLFEVLDINFRPVLIEIDGVNYLEASYPSSTTLLTITLLVSAIDQVIIYIKNKTLKNILIIACAHLAFLFVFCRTFSGVHWLTDIIGGLILSVVLLSFYMAIKGTFVKIAIKKTLSKI